MIVCHLEMWPKGDPARKYDLGLVTITNVGGTADTGDYEVVLHKTASHGAKRPGVWKRGQVHSFPRLRLGAYDLLFRALGYCIAYRNSHVPQGELGDTPPATEVEADG